MKKAKTVAEVVAGVWAGFLIVRIVLLVARLVGVIGAADTLAEWAGYPGAIAGFETWIDGLVFGLIEGVMP